MDNAEDLNVMKEELHELGSKHFKWGAKTAHFDVSLRSFSRCSDNECFDQVAS